MATTLLFRSFVMMELAKCAAVLSVISLVSSTPSGYGITSGALAGGTYILIHEPHSFRPLLFNKSKTNEDVFTINEIVPTGWLVVGN